MNKPVFYDPQRKRWKRVRRIFDAAALFGLMLGGIFVVGLMRMKPLPNLNLTTQGRNYRFVATPPRPLLKPGQKPLLSLLHRKTALKPSDVTMNTGEGLRAAYYVDWDAASYSSLKQHARQIDLLFPMWLHVLDAQRRADGPTRRMTTRPLLVVDKTGVHAVDQENKVARAIAAARSDTEVFPMVDNYDLLHNNFSQSLDDFLSSDTARANFIRQVDRFSGGKSELPWLVAGF